MKIPDFDKMEREQILDWVDQQEKSLSVSSFDKLLNVCGDDLKERLDYLDRLKGLVYELYEEVEEFDDAVSMYFDPESDKMLKKKVRVLKALKDGKGPEEIGKDYFDILEGFDQNIPNGTTVMVGDWEYDPEKYK